jgi:pSer/pThr/pTyr-binding forkhead associated (FHA) protein
VVTASTSQAPRVFPLAQGKRLVIGRDSKAGIALPDIAISRQHAEVFPGPGGFYIRDMDSSNGVIVNQARIDNPYLLTHGDRIVVGSNTIYFIDLRRPEAEGFSASRPYRQGGASSQLMCQRCGEANIERARFCGVCGAPLRQS